MRPETQKEIERTVEIYNVLHGLFGLTGVWLDLLAIADRIAERTYFNEDEASTNPPPEDQ